MNVALIMAGGSGSRMLAKEKKQFISIHGRELIAYTLAEFCGNPEIDKVIVVAPEADVERMGEICEAKFSQYSIEVIAGGSIRQRSVINGLEACPSGTELVLIHDAVRPFVSHIMLRELLQIAREKKAVIPCSPVRNTIKRIQNGLILETIPREDLYNAQTPQVFEYDLILKYHRLALEQEREFTDDSSILEYFGIPVYFYLSDDSNFKITEPHDLTIAGHLLQGQ